MVKGVHGAEFVLCASEEEWWILQYHISYDGGLFWHSWWKDIDEYDY